MTEKIPCSVLVLTRNSASSLERCLKPLADFAEIVVHDANSEDNTVEIAQKFGAKIFQQYDTEEKSVRVKDFTEMRLKQRAAASYDWVMYIDSDEELSAEAAAEIGEVLQTAHPKTIIKIPRIQVIEGIPRTRGQLTSDVMPRIHNRTSGATLRKGKTVHEKYEYDESFTELPLKSPLYVPIPSVAELRSKDDRYLTLEVERMKRDGYTWRQYVRWMLFREPLIMLVTTLRILVRLPVLFQKDAIPVAYHWRYVRYHYRLFRAMTGLMLQKTFSPLP
ncbi:MAG: glycosyltransferase [Candidatus Peribacteraceae bacterium]|nr:glycosyltransferase [Candidatus Peribacteraceae bacterium]